MPDRHIKRTHFSISEVAQCYGVSRRTVLRWITIGGLKATNVGTADKALWRVPVEALASFEREKTNRPTARRKHKRKPRRRQPTNMVDQL